MEKILMSMACMVLLSVGGAQATAPRPDPRETNIGTLYDLLYVLDSDGSPRVPRWFGRLPERAKNEIDRNLSGLSAPYLLQFKNLSELVSRYLIKRLPELHSSNPSTGSIQGRLKLIENLAGIRDGLVTLAHALGPIRFKDHDMYTTDENKRISKIFRHGVALPNASGGQIGRRNLDHPTETCTLGSAVKCFDPEVAERAMGEVKDSLRKRGLMNAQNTGELIGRKLYSPTAGQVHACFVLDVSGSISNHTLALLDQVKRTADSMAAINENVVVTGLAVLTNPGLRRNEAIDMTPGLKDLASLMRNYVSVRKLVRPHKEPLPSELKDLYYDFLKKADDSLELSWQGIEACREILLNESQSQVKLIFVLTDDEPGDYVSFEPGHKRLAAYLTPAVRQGFLDEMAKKWAVMGQVTVPENYRAMLSTAMGQKMRESGMSLEIYDITASKLVTMSAPATSKKK